MKAAATTIWKRSVPVVLTGPSRTAKKIGGALFPCLALPIRQLVTLRPSKAPITVCESALDPIHPPGKTFSFVALHSFASQSRSPLRAGISWIYRCETDSGRWACQARLCSRARPAVYPAPVGAQVASPQSLILRWSTRNLNQQRLQNNAILKLIT